MDKELKELKANGYARMIEILLIKGHIAFEDLAPVIEKGAAKMLGEKEGDVFNSNTTSLNLPIKGE